MPVFGPFLDFVIAVAITASRASGSFDEVFLAAGKRRFVDEEEASEYVRQIKW